MDALQIGLGAIGVFDPTPISDGINALISIGRGNTAAAAISTAAMLPYIGDTAKLAAGGARLALRAADSVAPVAAKSETAILTRLKDQAVARFEAEGLTPAQQRLFINDPSSFARSRGTQIDSFFKEAVVAHPDLQHLITTPRYKFGPDVFDPANQRWWDVTTPGQWDAHVRKYWLFGDGTPLLTH